MAFQTRFPTSLILEDNGQVAWSNSTNVLADDGAVASVALNSGQYSWLLIPSACGFSIPSGATITGVTLTVRHRRTGSVVNISASLTTDGTSLGILGSTPVGDVVPTAWTVDTFSAFDALPTVAQANGSGFGVVLSIIGPFGAVTVEVDYVTLTITYTGGGGGSDGDVVISPIFLFLS